MPTPLRPLRTAVAALRSAATYLLVSLYVFIVAPPTLLIGKFRPVENLVYALSRGGVRLSLFLTGIRIRVAGRENQPRGRGAVYCANHESNVDAPVLFFALHPRLHMLYKAEFARVPLLGQAIRLAHCVPVYRDDRDRSIGWLNEAVPILAAGTPFLFFPEGTRSVPGTLLPFKKGGFIMAIQAQAPVVPVVMHGAYEAMRRGSAVINPVTISVRIGQPIETTGLTIADRDVIVEKVKASIRALLAQGPL